MINATIFPGRYVQGNGAVNLLGEEMARWGKKVLLICDPYVYDELLPRFRQDVETHMEVVTEEFRGESSDEEIERLTVPAETEGCDVIAGVGGGKTLDTAKAVAHERGLPVAIIPTIASTDAPCSALSVIYTPEGAFKRYLFLPRNPELVLLDSAIIAKAPVEFLVAGMGDALATWFEAESCRKKHASNMTGHKGSMAAYALAELCYDTLLEYGVAAKVACENQAVTPALERIIEANTLLSGLGFESGGIASAHAIHNGLTVLEQAHGASHGGKVTFGTLSSLFLTDKPNEVVNEVYTFCESVGLPTTFAGIGLSNVTDEELLKVAETACAEGETIHNEPIPVNPSMVVSALKVADAFGRKRQG